MKVIATEIGFYGKLIKAGEMFVIKDKSHLGKWMQEVEIKVEVKIPTKKTTKKSKK